VNVIPDYGRQMHANGSSNGKRWLSALVWGYRAIVAADFLLIALYELAALELRRIAAWMVTTTGLILLATVIFAIRSVKDRKARNDVFLGLLWLLCVTFVVLRPPEEPSGIRIYRTR